MWEVDVVRLATVLAVVLACLSSTLPGHAEPSSIKIARQFGILYLPLMVMEDGHLLERHARDAGLGDISVSFIKLGGGNATNDALLSGAIDFAATGTPELVLLWSKTKGAMKGVGGLSAMPMYLNTRNSEVKQLSDFGEKNKIAVPAVKISGSALVLQMAAEKRFGTGSYQKLDTLTVSLGHPDGYAAMSSGISEVDSHFTISPFADLELAKIPGVHTILTSYDVLDGPSTSGTVITTTKFHDQNPKSYSAFVLALQEAIDIANHEKRRAAETYLRLSGDRQLSIDDLVGILSNPKNEFSIKPQKVEVFADFMNRIGLIPKKPESWKDLFFTNVHDLGGS